MVEPCLGTRVLILINHLIFYTMAKLNKNSNKNFQCESIDELLEFNTGITRLFQALFALWNHQPVPTEEDCISFETTLRIQEEAQVELAKRIKENVGEIDRDNRHDILD